jgi:hypothetical protein
MWFWNYRLRASEGFGQQPVIARQARAIIESSLFIGHHPHLLRTLSVYLSNPLGVTNNGEKEHPRKRTLDRLESRG